nr:porin family protein [Mucilaginibacter gotjawali]
MLLFSTAFTFAQTINYGIKAGLNLSTLSLTGPGFTNYGKYLPGFNAGGIVNIEFSNFTIQPGLFYSTKGEQITLLFVDANQQNPQKATLTYRLNFIELPINFLYKIVKLQDGNLHIGGGPYLGYGISANSSINGTNTSLSYSKYYRNPDYGINFIVGAEFINKFIVDAGYGLGFANLGGGSTPQNRVFSFSVGYLFR